jgi:hypothetical protein
MELHSVPEAKPELISARALNVRSYLQRSVVCPAGGTSFEDSYTITTVETAPTCQRKPGSHKLPL